MPYKIRPTGTLFPRAEDANRTITDDTIVDYYENDSQFTISMTLKEARRRDRNDKIESCFIDVITVILLLVLISGLYFLLYWVPITFFHAQPIVCFGCK